MSEECGGGVMSADCSQLYTLWFIAARCEHSALSRSMFTTLFNSTRVKPTHTYTRSLSFSAFYNTPTADGLRTAFANTVRNPLANLVGYETHSVNAGDFCPLAIQLEAINNSTGEIAIKDLLTVDDPRGRTSLHSWADQIHVWDGLGWVKYFYNTEGKWVLSSDVTHEAVETVKAGQTVFFLRSTRAAGNVTLSGGVHLANAPISTEVAAGDFAFVCYPWPMQFAIKDFKGCISDIRGRTSLHSWADQIHRWDGLGWTKYYYNSTLEGFVKVGEEDKITEETLNVGEGVFFLRSTRAGATLTFTKPENLK